MEQTKQIEEQLTQAKIVFDKLANKDFTLYFFTLDTKGNPTAGIANIYEHVKLLNELGYKAIILHEKNDYKLKGDDQKDPEHKRSDVKHHHARKGTIGALVTIK